MNFDLTPDQQQLQARVRDFAQAEVAPIAEKLDRDGVFPAALYRQLGDLGVMSIPFDEKFGGMGLGVFEAVLALEEIARADQSLAVSAMVSMATGLTLARFGGQPLIDKWLPEIVTGQKMCAIAGTEPNAGSDTAGFRTRARMIGNDRWPISGEKAYITNAGTEVTIFTLLLTVTARPMRRRSSSPCSWSRTTRRATNAARSTASSDGAHPIRARSISTIARSMPTMSSARRTKAAGSCTRATRRRGSSSRRVAGFAQASLDHAIKYAQERQAFGGSLGRLQLIQEMIADMALQVDTARLVTYRAAWGIDQGRDNLKELSMAKYLATEAGTKCADIAIQVHGGWGYMDDCPVSRYYRDNRVCTIGDGSSQIQKLLIARECGLDVTFT